MKCKQLLRTNCKTNRCLADNVVTIAFDFPIYLIPIYRHVIIMTPYIHDYIIHERRTMWEKMVLSHRNHLS